MTRSQLEHIIRAAGTIADSNEIIVVGSQAILGQFPEAPPEFVVSYEADVFPRDFPERADLIDGSIGDGSPFEREFGYFAHGVGPETAVLPDGWESRLVVISNENTRGIRGLCLEVHDLAISKLVASREKDLDFVSALARYGMASKDTLMARLEMTALSDDVRGLVAARIAKHFGG